MIQKADSLGNSLKLKFGGWILALIEKPFACGAITVHGSLGGTLARSTRPTTFDINNQQLVVEYADPSPADAPKLTTFDLHNQHQTVEYGDPALLPKRRTTNDAAVERLTQEYQPV